MIEIDKVDITGWEAAIRGMRNPLESWEKSDSMLSHDPTCGSNTDCTKCEGFGTCCYIGEADHKLMKNLAEDGSDHAKYRRMITVYADINAPLYWWKEFDTYKVGTVANSCSTMHKIHTKWLELDDFSHEKLDFLGKRVLESTIISLNDYIATYKKTQDKVDWYSIIQLLPSSYNQLRTIQLNYEVLANIYKSRKNHKLDEWKDFCKWIEALPYSDIITGE